jgi:hypothetical protein
MGVVLAGQRQPSPAEIMYNYCMVAAFYAGVLGYFVFAAARAIVDVQHASSVQLNANRRASPILGIAIFIAKVGFLGICWYVFLTALER